MVKDNLFQKGKIKIVLDYYKLNNINHFLNHLFFLFLVE